MSITTSDTVSTAKLDADNMSDSTLQTTNQVNEDMDTTQSKDAVMSMNQLPSKGKEKNPEAVSGRSSAEEEDYIDSIVPPFLRNKNVMLYTDDVGPQMYNAKAAKGNLVTPPIVTKRLPDVYAYQPVFGRPGKNEKMEDFFANKIKEFIGCDINEEDFRELEGYCSPEHLKIGKEVVMRTKFPVMGVLTGNIIQNNSDPDESTAKKTPSLCILKRNRMRNGRDGKGLFAKKLKYRGVRILPFTQEPNPFNVTPPDPTPDEDLEPGKDLIYRVRVYRPYAYYIAKDRYTRTRHSVFCFDIILTGRHKLSQLRDRFVCHNDFDMRVDVSNHPDMLPKTKAKEVFPSGFLFINNVFYVDTREGCVDYSEPIRAWAKERDLGDFPKKDMCSVTMGELVLKLGYPEVYVHQGNCEHVFIFSEVRLLGPTDPLLSSHYPCSSAIAQNQTTYCTTCAELSAKWIVVGCSRVPFDPSFFCENCFKQYLYKDGEKIGDFKAYTYRGNALNILKPQ